MWNARSPKAPPPCAAPRSSGFANRARPPETVPAHPGRGGAWWKPWGWPQGGARAALWRRRTSPPSRGRTCRGRHQWDRMRHPPRCRDQTDGPSDFSQAEKYIKHLIKYALKNKFANGVCLNVNIPKLKASKLKGIKVVRQAKAMWVEKFEERKDPYGRDYFWLTGSFINYEKNATDTDEWALANGYISVVPTMVDLTAHLELSNLKTLE